MTNTTQKMARIMKECAQAERTRVMAAPDSDIPTERCIDGRYVSVTQKKLAYRQLDEFRRLGAALLRTPLHRRDGQRKDDMRTAPWTDYAGNEIKEGDAIRHPSGEQGVVCFWPHEAEPSDQWRVFYAENGAKHSRLCLQIGDKGQAVVVPNAIIHGSRSGPAGMEG